MKKMSAHLLLCLFLQLIVIGAMAQQRRISGTVTDDKGSPAAGISYHIKGTTITGSTDENGYFNVNVPDANSVLEFTSVNFQTKEITVGNSSTLHISLDPKNASLGEVV